MYVIMNCIGNAGDLTWYTSLVGIKEMNGNMTMATNGAKSTNHWPCECHGVYIALGPAGACERDPAGLW